MTAGGKIWAAAARCAAPGLRLMLRLRLARGKELPGRLAERRGIDAYPRPPGRLLWVHAASVGETASILPVLPPLLAGAPDLTVLVTTGTVTAARLLAQRLRPEQKKRVLHRFVPLDVPAWVGRFLDHWRPDAAAFLESELWPNLLDACHARHIPLMLVNARLSPRSFARWRRAPAFARELLGRFDRVQARSEADAERLRLLGARACRGPRRPEIRRAAAAGRCGGAGAVARHAGGPPGLAGRQHASGRGGAGPRRAPGDRGEAPGPADHPGAAASGARRVDRGGRGAAADHAAGAGRVATGRTRRVGGRYARRAGAVVSPGADRLRRPQPAAARAAGRTRWSRRGWAAPSLSGRIPAISRRPSRCCGRRAGWLEVAGRRLPWPRSSRRCWPTRSGGSPWASRARRRRAAAHGDLPDHTAAALLALLALASARVGGEAGDPDASGGGARDRAG